MRGSPKLSSQSAATTGPPLAPPVHDAGTFALRSAWRAISSRSGGALSAHAPSARSAEIVAACSSVARRIGALMQFQDERVELRAHPQEDLADDVQELERFGIDRADAYRAGGE